MKRFEDFTREDYAKLRSEICLGSLYISDYNNSFGLDPNWVCSFFEGFMDFIEEEAEEDGFKGTWDEIRDKYDTTDMLERWGNCFDDCSGISYDFSDAESFSEYNDILLVDKEFFGNEEEHPCTMEFFDGFANGEYMGQDIGLKYPTMEELSKDYDKWSEVTFHTGRYDINPFDIALKFGEISTPVDPETKKTFKVVYVVADETDKVEVVKDIREVYRKGVEYIKENIGNYPDARVEVMAEDEDPRCPSEDFRVLKRDIYDHDNFFWTMMKVSDYGVRLYEYFKD